MSWWRTPNSGLSSARMRSVAQSLRIKATGEELLDNGERLPLFSATQDRPFDNELKLAFPNKRTTYQANRVRRLGDTLVVGFEQE